MRIKFAHFIDPKDEENNVHTIETICPRCKSEYGLILMHRREYKNHTEMKIRCISCKSKFNKIYRKENMNE